MAAFLLVASNQSCLEEKINQLLQEKGINPNPNNPNLLVIKANNKKISINQIRQIKKFLAYTCWQKGRRGVVIHQSEKLTLPAQNAFLKTLEEHPRETILVLTTPNPNLLLPTIVSRCHLITLPTTPTLENNFPALTTIAQLPLAEKLAFGEKLVQQNQVEAFVKAQIFAYQNLLAQNPRLLRLLEEARQLLNTNLSPQTVVDYLLLQL